MRRHAFASLIRFFEIQFSINLEHTVDNREQPYLNLRLHTLYYETAMMEYGVAVQFGIGSILLVDKTNAGVTGSYLELISTDQSYEVLVVSYRKVSHAHQSDLSRPSPATNTCSPILSTG